MAASETEATAHMAYT